MARSAHNQAKAAENMNRKQADRNDEGLMSNDERMTKPELRVVPAWRVGADSEAPPCGGLGRWVSKTKAKRGRRVAGTSLICKARPKSAPAERRRNFTSLTFASRSGTAATRHRAAKASDRAGISNMQEALSCKKVGGAMNRTVATAAASNPFTRWTNMNTEARIRAAKATVRSRGPTMDGERCFKIWVMRKVCSGGWSSQTSE